MAKDKQSAANIFSLAFTLGRLTNAFEFQVSQALALSMLPTDDCLNEVGNIYVAQAIKTLDCIEAAGATLKSKAIQDSVSKARAALKQGAFEVDEQRMRLHIRRVSGLKSGYRILQRSRKNQSEIDSQISKLGLRIRDRIAVFAAVVPADDQLAALVPPSLRKNSAYIMQHIGDFRPPRNLESEAYAIGVALDECVRPSNVVSFMNLTLDPRIIAQNTYAVTEKHGNISTAKQHLQSCGNDNSWRIIRTFNVGDIKPSPTEYLTLVRHLLEYEFVGSLIPDLICMRKVFVDWQTKDEMAQSACTPEELVDLVDRIDRIITYSFVCPSYSTNRRRNAFIYEKRRKGLSFKEVISLSNKSGFDVISTIAAAKKAADTHAVMTGSPRLTSARGRPRKRPSDES